MCFKLNNYISFLLTPIVSLATLMLPNMSVAEEIKQNQVILQMTPKMCVALTQGRTCYAKVTLEWSAAYSGDFCVVRLDNENTQQKIQCWTQSKGSSVNFEFKSSESLTYQIITNENETLAETTLNVSWVHENSPRKRRWRLF